MLDLDRVKQSLHTPTPAPLHARLRTAIQAQIMDGTLRPGESLPSERTLQKHLNVSRATVRQAIGALIQAGLLQSIPGTGTFVIHREAASARQGMIALVTTSPNFHFFYPQLANAFYARLHTAGYALALELYDDSAEDLARHVEELLLQDVVGLAIVPPRFGDIISLTIHLKQQQVPFVFIGRRVTAPPDGPLLADCVATDHEEIGYQATRHLIDLGHRRIVHFGFSDYSTGQDRIAGYRRAMAEAGLSPQVIELPIIQENASPPVLPYEYLADPSYQLARALWTDHAPPHPTAVFCFNDAAAMGVYKALRDLELCIPGDVSLISVDNLPTIRHFEVPMTTFALPGEAVGREGAKVLLRRLQGDTSPPREYLLPAQLIRRLSTAPPPPDHTG